MNFYRCHLKEQVKIAMMINCAFVDMCFYSYHQYDFEIKTIRFWQYVVSQSCFIYNYILKDLRAFKVLPKQLIFVFYAFIKFLNILIKCPHKFMQ